MLWGPLKFLQAMALWVPFNKSTSMELVPGVARGPLGVLDQNNPKDVLHSELFQTLEALGPFGNSMDILDAL